jgi:phosphatidylserine/phosphatidylglycerophosphate/cardiolipin synthase-like enzyme
MLCHCLKSLFLLPVLCLFSIGAYSSVLSFHEASDLIQVESRGAVFLNPSPEAPDVVSNLSFVLKDKVLTPEKIFSPESIQSLFLFDPSKFTSLENAANFLDAKESYFRKLKYSFSKKRFLQDQTILSDWGGLNHPPMHKLPTGPLEWLTPTAVEAQSGARETPEFHERIDKLSNSELTSGNSFDPFLDQEVLPRIVTLVKNSKTTLWASALLFSCDASTKPLVDALIERAKAGVDVRVMVDRTLQLMQKNNCKKEFAGNGIKLILVPGMILKGSAQHVKLWMRDLEEGIFLGANLIDIQVQATGFNFLFHDSGMNIKGPSVTDMAQRFLEIWNLYTKSSLQIGASQSESISLKLAAERSAGLRGADQYMRWFQLPKNERPKGMCRVVTQERHLGRERVSQTVGEYLKTAQSRIWLTSVRRDFHRTLDHPEIGYNKILIDTFTKAKDEGVQVEMMFNAAVNPYSVYSVPNTGLPARKFGLKDRLMQMHLNHSTDKALRDGADFFEKTNLKAPLFRAWSYFSYSHMKNIMIDEDVVITGSYNPLDERSTDDAEIALFCQDKELSTKYSQSFARDLVNSIPYPFKSQITK